MPAKTLEYRAENRRVISVDGEGHTLEGRHAYTLLASADDRGMRRNISHDGTIRAGTGSIPFQPEDVAPNHGLPTRDCLEFLLRLPKRKSDLVISFAFTYDVTKILQDMPLKNLNELADTNQTTWKGYQLNYLPRKHFEIRKDTRKVTVWDTFSYWQMSFVKALASSKELFTPEQRETIDFIRYMKDHRHEFDTMPDDEILEYCYTECEYLSILFRDFLRHIEALNLPVTRYSGPGGISEAFFKAENITKFMPKASASLAAPGLPASIPQKSYYGGRFEISVMGNVGDVIEYDIHSAYPAIAVDLPCLRCGRFERVTDFEPGALGFYYVESRTAGPWAPFPFRSNRESARWLNGAKPGSIAFVHGGRRWVTSYEVEVARKHFGSKAIPVLKGYVYRTPCAHRPFKRLHELYLIRKEGNPSEGLSKIIKLLINSVYGKTAQAIGGRNDQWGDYRPPTYQCHIWAAWMTGGTRAKVMDAALRAPNDVVSIATDGILSKVELPSTDDFPITDYQLGTWERTPKSDCWLGMPGIYAFGRDDMNDKAFKRRGLDRRYFPASHLRDTWDSGEWRVNALLAEGEKVIAFMPLRLAVKRTDSLGLLGEWPEMTKSQNFMNVQHKRQLPEWVDTLGSLREPGQNTVPLGTITIPDDIESEPYRAAGAVTHIDKHAEELDIPMWEAEDFADFDALSLV
jgi:DNA polymerase type B, organellar and viral